jgi:type II secretion system protein H
MQQRGFTLLETLVVVVIIALVAATVVLSTSSVGRDRELQTEADRLLALLRYTREQAELRTREFGLLCDETQYEFVSFDPRKQLWVSVVSDETLRVRKLPEGLNLALQIEARPVVLRRPPDSKDLTPQIMLYSNGDVTPFAVTVRRSTPERNVVISSEENGLIVASAITERDT